jgi:hypothetical protein
MSMQIVSVSQNAVVQAESEVVSCDRCDSEATTPFWKVLDKFRSYQDSETVYILPVLATCPNCCAQIDEITLVEMRSVPDCSPANQVLSQSEA